MSPLSTLESFFFCYPPFFLTDLQEIVPGLQSLYNLWCPSFLASLWVISLLGYGRFSILYRKFGIFFIYVLWGLVFFWQGLFCSSRIIAIFGSFFFIFLIHFHLHSRSQSVISQFPFFLFLFLFYNWVYSYSSFFFLAFDLFPDSLDYYRFF